MTTLEEAIEHHRARQHHPAGKKLDQAEAPRTVEDAVKAYYRATAGPEAPSWLVLPTHKRVMWRRAYMRFRWGPR